MTVPVTQARQEIADIVDRVRYTGERVVLSKNGKNVAAIVPIADLERLEQLLDEYDVKEAERILADPTQRPVPFAPSRRKRRK